MDLILVIGPVGLQFGPIPCGLIATYTTDAVCDGGHNLCHAHWASHIQGRHDDRKGFRSRKSDSDPSEAIFSVICGRAIGSIVDIQETCAGLHHHSHCRRSTSGVGDSFNPKGFLKKEITLDLVRVTYISREILAQLWRQLCVSTLSFGSVSHSTN